MSKIIFPNDGGLAVIHPTGDIPVEQVALKDVPIGVPFLIVDDADVPADRAFREAWTADFSNPHGHGIGHEAWAEWAAQQQEVVDVNHD